MATILAGKTKQGATSIVYFGWQISIKISMLIYQQCALL
jgi:hypothetical protein